MRTDLLFVLPGLLLDSAPQYSMRAQRCSSNIAKCYNTAVIVIGQRMHGCS
jgi:hypothetical protein